MAVNPPYYELPYFRADAMSSLPQASESGSSPQTCDQSTATDLDDVSIPATNEDLSLPLSIDSGLDLSSDYKVNEKDNSLSSLFRCK